MMHEKKHHNESESNTHVHTCRNNCLQQWGLAACCAFPEHHSVTKHSCVSYGRAASSWHLTRAFLTGHKPLGPQQPSRGSDCCLLALRQ